MMTRRFCERVGRPKAYTFIAMPTVDSAEEAWSISWINS